MWKRKETGKEREERRFRMLILSSLIWIVEELIRKKMSPTKEDYKVRDNLYKETWKMVDGAGKPGENGVKPVGK